MLIRKQILERIKKGEVTLAFRRWRRPTVKSGGTLKTGIGVLAIDGIETVAEESITERDARRAGHADRESLLDELGSREGEVYRIALRYAGADPRIALRENADLDASEISGIQSHLHRLDAASRHGPWTLKVLTAIRQSPNRAARDLANETGFEKEWLKTNIRKLKNLGLTVSHHPGYTLSPRGRAVLERMTEDEG